MQSQATTVTDYLNSLETPRREELTTLRNLINANIPSGYTEGILWGMIAYFIPLEKYPNTYNNQPLCYIALASQKNYISLYLTCVYMNELAKSELIEAFAKANKKLDMGKSCLRFKSIVDIPLEAIAKVIQQTTPNQFIQIYEKSRQTAKLNN